MIAVSCYPSLFLAKQELVRLIIHLLLVVNDSCIPTLVGYEFLRYEAFVCSLQW